MEGGRTDGAYGVEGTRATASFQHRAPFQKEEVESGLTDFRRWEIGPSGDFFFLKEHS